MSPTSPERDRVATLTATVDQLQAEHDRAQRAQSILLFAFIGLAAALWMQQRQLELVVRRIRRGVIE